MSLTTSEMTPADIRACTCGNDGYNNGGMWGNDWAWIIILLLFGYGGRGFGFGGGFGGGVGGGCGAPCATQADVRAAVDQQTLISKLDNAVYGLTDSTFALNNSIMNGFHGVDNAICTLGYQNQQGFSALASQLAQCCCDTRAAIKDGVTQGVMNTNSIQRSIDSCCCDLEKMNMQNRFDAQAYNCNTLQAIDKLGDRIIDHLTQDKIATLTAENQSLKFQASQTAQNAFISANQDAQTAELIRRLGRDCPIPAYVVPNPNCCYGNPVGVSYGYNGGCGCGNGNF